MAFEKSEFLKITEEIYTLKSKKKELELSLNSEEFHYQYIKKRRNLVVHEVVFRGLLFIIPLTCIVLYAFYCICFCFMYQKQTDTDVVMGVVSKDGLMDVILLLMSLTFVFGGYAAIRLWIRQIRMFKLLLISWNPKKTIKIFEKFEINTFQNDEFRTEERLKWLKDEISSLENRLSILTKQQQDILDAENRERIISEQYNPNDSITDQFSQEGKFRLRKTNMGTADASLLHEFYLREERDVKQRLIRMEGQLQRINKRIVQIDEDFEEVKRKMKFSLIVYVFLIIIHSFFSGKAAVVTNFICLIVSLIYIFYVEKKWKQPILLYLIENESNLTSEYAFCNNIIPVKIERNEMLREIENCKKELDDIKEKKESINFS